MISYKINPAESEWPELLKRPSINSSEIEPVVENILLDVKHNGDSALKKYTLQFDNAEVNTLQVSSDEINIAVNNISAELKAAIGIAKENIYKFHFAQKRSEPVVDMMPGLQCWRKQIAIEKVGLYIPGGSAPLFSTLLMLAIPAQIAGCKEIVVCTPPNSSGEIDDAILYVASVLGVDKIYKVGGVQAIAAMTFGTETIPAVYKLFGPGNQYVTAAKQLATKYGVAIDMPAGPSEVAIYADESCVPAFVAADLLSQAEHGADSQVMLVASDEDTVIQIIDQVSLQLDVIVRTQAIEAIRGSHFIVLNNVDRAFNFLNQYAAEHLILATDNAFSLADKIINAGSVFLGNFTPEAAGDYASGTNHTLPTNGFAKTYSGVSVDSFSKLVTFQQMNKTALEKLGPVIETMAEAEGLYAHSAAIKIRTNNIE